VAFLSAANAHHNVALVETGCVAWGDNLHHFALKVGDSLDDLAAVKRTLAANQVAVI